MTALNFAQAQALAGLMREHDSQDATILDIRDRVLLVTLYDDSQDIVTSGSITTSGCIREHARTPA